MGGYGWFNGEWVNNNTLRCFRLQADILLFSEPHAASTKVDFCELKIAHIQKALGDQGGSRR